MPQASDKLRERMNVRFGDPIDDGGPIKFLKGAGFILTPQWSWLSPKPEDQITDDEWECITFLVHEWDFDGLVRP